MNLLEGLIVLSYFLLAATFVGGFVLLVGWIVEEIIGPEEMGSGENEEW